MENEISVGTCAQHGATIDGECELCDEHTHSFDIDLMCDCGMWVGWLNRPQ